MGHIFSSKENNIHESLHSSILNQTVLHHLYYSKIFQQHKKSIEYFIQQIEAVCKKISYLNYQWAQDIALGLQSSKINELYIEYQSIFHENCRRQGHHQLVFHAKELRRQFLQQITKRYNTKKTTLDIPQLKSLIFQCKCYFMLMNWFHKISLFDEKKINDRESEGNQIFVKFYHEDAVYEEMVQVANKTYVQYIEKEWISTISDEYCELKLKNQEIFKECRKIKVYMKFHEKQQIILQLQSVLLQNDLELDQNMEQLQKMLEQSKLFAYLLIIKELGSGDVSKLWERIYGNKYDNLQS